MFTGSEVNHILTNNQSAIHFGILGKTGYYFKVIRAPT